MLFTVCGIGDDVEEPALSAISWQADEDLIDEVYAIRMERLTKFTNHDFLLQYIEDKVKGCVNSEYSPIRYDADALKRHYPLLEAACVAIGDIVFNGPSQCMADFHSGNIMLRGDIPVIIDPAAHLIAKKSA